MSVLSEFGFASRAWLAAPVVELCLAWGGLHRTLRWIERFAPLRQPPDASSLAGVGAERGERLIDRAYRLHALRGECLPRSLVQYWLHRRDGTAVRFVVGVRKGARAPASRHNPAAGTVLEAHAWVEPLQSAGERPEDDRHRGGGFETLLVREAEPRRESSPP